MEEDEHADESHQEDENGNTADDKKDGAGGGGSSPDTVMSHMASATVAAFLQMAVRTGEYIYVYIVCKVSFTFIFQKRVTDL